MGQSKLITKRSEMIVLSEINFSKPSKMVIPLDFHQLESLIRYKEGLLQLQDQNPRLGYNMSYKDQKGIQREIDLIDQFVKYKASELI